MSENNTIVIDNGSFKFKIGYSDDPSMEPRLIFRNLYGEPRYKYLVPNQANNYYIGDNIFDNLGSVDIKYPVVDGNVTNWDQMEKVLEFGFNQLKAVTEEQGVLISESSNITKGNREKMIEIMFETFNVPYYYSINQGVLNVISSGKTSGYSIDVGYSHTQIVPVNEFHAVEYSILYEKLAGHEIIQFLRRLLNDANGCALFRDSITYDDSLHKMLCESCYVAECYWKMKSSSSSSNKISYGCDMIEVKDSFFKSPELLFDPSLFYGNDCNLKPIHQLFFESREKCYEYFEDIILSGGISKMKGFKERFEGEMKSNGSETFHLNVSNELGSYYGGALLGYNSGFTDIAVKRNEYDEDGVTIVHYKCF